MGRPVSVCLIMLSLACTASSAVAQVVHVHGAPLHNRALDQASDFFRDTYGGHMVHLWGLVPVLAG